MVRLLLRSPIQNLSQTQSFVISYLFGWRDQASIFQLFTPDRLFVLDINSDEFGLIVVLIINLFYSVIPMKKIHVMLAVMVG